MICVKCYQASTNVTNSRPHKKQASVWRRRHCEHCGFTFTTTEKPLSEELLEIVSADGVSTPFSLPRLSINLHSVLTHKQDAAEAAYWLGETVYQTIVRRGNANTAVPIHEFTTVVHEVLSRFDALASLQYATRHQLVTNIRKNTGRPRIK